MPYAMPFGYNSNSYYNYGAINAGYGSPCGAPPPTTVIVTQQQPYQQPPAAAAPVTPSYAPVVAPQPQYAPPAQQYSNRPYIAPPSTGDAGLAGANASNELAPFAIVILALGSVSLVGMRRLTAK